MRRNASSASLSADDGIAIASLLIFICVWFGGWVFIFSAGDLSSFGESGSGADGVASLVQFFLMVLPPLWAGGCINRVIDGREMDRTTPEPTDKPA